MPSFRASVAVIRTLPGVAPDAVLDAAQHGIAAHFHIEDAFVDVDSLRNGAGLPRVTIRFVVPATSDHEENALAWTAAKSLAGAVGHVAEWSQLRVFRRVKGRWLLLDAQP